MSAHREPEKLTPKQRRFVEEYLVDLNATQAAIRAGYSERTAGAIGAENLAKPEIRQALAHAQSRVAEKVAITVERVLLELSRLAFLDVRRLFDDLGNLKPINKLDDATAAAIVSFDVEVRPGRDSVRVFKIKLCDKKGALDSIAKHLGMFVDRHEHTGKGGGSIVHDLGLDLSKLTDEQFEQFAALVEIASPAEDGR